MPYVDVWYCLFCQERLNPKSQIYCCAYCEFRAEGYALFLAHTRYCTLMQDFYKTQYASPSPFNENVLIGSLNHA